MTSARRPEATAGIIAAVAALITAVVGACAFLYQVIDKKDDNASPPAGVQRTGDPGGSNGSNGSGGPAGSNAQPPAGGSGPHEVVLTANGIDFDVIPPRAFTKFDDAVDAHGDNMLVAYPSGAGIARWSGAAPPSRQDCVNAINSAPMGNAPVTVGSRFCLVTVNQGHYAYLEFTAKAENGFRLRATIWPGL